jgi:hypothetical protein
MMWLELFGWIVLFLGPYFTLLGWNAMFRKEGEEKTVIFSCKQDAFVSGWNAIMAFFLWACFAVALKKGLDGFQLFWTFVWIICLGFGLFYAYDHARSANPHISHGQALVLIILKAMTGFVGLVGIFSHGSTLFDSNKSMGDKAGALVFIAMIGIMGSYLFNGRPRVDYYERYLEYQKKKHIHTPVK